MNIGTRGKMPPLIVHCMPGLAVEESRLAADVEREGAVEVARGVERRRCGPAVRGRVELRPARRGAGGSAVPSRAQRQPDERALDRELHRCRRHRERDVVAAAGGEHERPARERRRADEIGAVDRDHLERRAADVEALRRAVGVDQPQAHRRCPAATARRSTPSVEFTSGVPLSVWTATAMSAPRPLAARRWWRLDHERAVEAAAHLGGRRLVRVVPERPDLRGPEAVDVAPARRDGVLRHAGDAVLGVRQVDAVPVDRDAVLDVLVAQRHLDEVALADAQLGPGHGAVERERLDGPARCEPDRRRARPSA